MIDMQAKLEELQKKVDDMQLKYDMYQLQIVQVQEDNKKAEAFKYNFSDQLQAKLADIGSGRIRGMQVPSGR